MMTHLIYKDVNMKEANTFEQQPNRIVLERLGETVRLLQLVPDDAQSYYDLIAYDPDHLRQHGEPTADKYPNVESVRRSIEHPTNPHKYRFGIWDDSVMIGSNNITLEEEGRAELGSWVGKQYIGRGYAGRGRNLLVDFAFKTLGLREVHCDIAVGNEASRRSVEKSGFVFIGEVADDMGERKWRYVLKNNET